MTIGFFHSINLLAVDIITLLEKFAKDGHKVVLITMHPYGHLHKELEGSGVIFEYLGTERKSRYQYYIGNAKKLAAICKKHEVDILYNNLAESQLIGLLSKLFRKTPMLYYRHFPDNYILTCSKKEKYFETAISRLSKHILVPSATCIPYLQKYEGINPAKVTAINLTYSLKYYAKDAAKTQDLLDEKNREGFLMLVSMARMVPVKRIQQQLEIAARLKAAGVQFKFYILGGGPLYDALKQQLEQMQLTDCCIMPGFVPDVMTYMSAADILVHTSESEASSHVIKEAGLLKKAVICCNNVGDFNQYLTNNDNAFLVDINNVVEQMAPIIINISNRSIDAEKTGLALYNTVISRFTVENVIEQHYKMINNILND
jgi:glycosyltransferase involved in cell wall biosynthesis